MLHSLMAVLGLCHDGIVLCMPVNTAVPLAIIVQVHVAVQVVQIPHIRSCSS